jgi:quercetin dioxygenase-like cupin family protein
MVIKELLEELRTRDQPLAKALHKGAHSKVLVLGFKKGMLMKEHVAHLPSKLVVLSGAVVYTEGAKATTLRLYEEIEIPVGIVHAVEALEDSLCLLAQGKAACDASCPAAKGQP